MSHLKCNKHKRRVVVVDGKALHRSTLAGELSPTCDTKTVVSGAASYLLTSENFHARDEKAERLLKEIFEGGE